MTAAALVAAACAGDGGGDGPAPVRTHAARIFGVTSLDYVVSYAHQVSVFTVDAEHQHPMKVQGDSQRVNRSVDVTMTEHLWVSPGHEPWDRTTFFAEGWLVKLGEDGTETWHPFVGDGPRLEPGNTYVAAFVLYGSVIDPDYAVLAPIGQDFIFLLQDGRLVADERHPPAEFTPARHLDGWTPRQLADALARAEVLPEARPWMHIDSGSLRVMYANNPGKAAKDGVTPRP